MTASNAQPPHKRFSLPRYIAETAPEARPAKVLTFSIAPKQDETQNHTHGTPRTSDFRAGDGTLQDGLDLP